MHHAEGFAVVSTHAHFKTMNTGVVIGDDTTHFKSAYFASHHAMFNDHIGTTVGDGWDK